MSKPKILLQLDTDDQTSVFDSVVAVDAGVEQLFRHHGISPENAEALVHGAMFTRGPADLKNTAIFVGGSDVAAGEALAKAVTKCFFGPMRVSVMMDSNGSNTTAAAAVLAAAKHLDLQNVNALVLAATGPVGSRVIRLLVGQGAKVTAASRKLERSEAVCQSILKTHPDANLSAVASSDNDQLSAALTGVNVVFACGAAGIELLPLEIKKAATDLKVVIDLNAVPPLGIAGVEVMDAGIDRDDIISYGAIGVGGTKMKIHKEAIRRLFVANDLELDAEEIFAIGEQIAK